MVTIHYYCICYGVVEPLILVLMSDSTHESKNSGTLYAAAAFVAWGLVPAYWKLLSHVPSTEILVHRVLWSATFFMLLLAFSCGGIKKLLSLFQTPGALKRVALAALLIGTNWFFFIYAVTSGQVLQASLGYFMTPLLNVLIGSFLLGERMKRAHWVAFGFAAAGVLALSLGTGAVPSLALVLAGSFGVYGLIRKKLAIEPLVASTAEGLLLVIPALLYMLAKSPSAIAAESVAPSGYSAGTLSLLVFGGVVSALPLMWFAKAARRLPLSTIGFFQYLSPSISFLLAVFVYGERFTTAHAVSHGLIWAGLIIFAASSLRPATIKR